MAALSFYIGLRATRYVVKKEASPDFFISFDFRCIDLFPLFPFRKPVTPEPFTCALFGIGAIGMLIVMRRKKAV